ncbi:MAG: class I SAM-dependent methyltransferase, partial [Actinomycetota bacterium]
ERDDHWLGFFRDLAQRIVDGLAPETVLDAGCAMGFLVEALRNLGVDASGVDVSSFALGKVHDSIKEHVWEGSLTEPLPRRYDLITCIEVLEHLPAPEAELALANLCNATDRLLFSSSPFDYAEPTHVNVRPPEEWSEMLARHGLVRDVDFELSPLVPWAALYRRTDAPLAGVVRDYDRSWWRLKYELHEVRGSVLELQRRLESVDWEHQRELEEMLREREAELDDARARIRDLEEPQRMLDSRSGRILQAYHRARAALRQ